MAGQLRLPKMVRAGDEGRCFPGYQEMYNHCTVSPVPDHCPSVPLVPGCGEIFEEDHLIRCVCVQWEGGGWRVWHV